MSDRIGGHKGPINHSLHGSALLLCSIEAWPLVRQCPCSAFLSINSCFTISLQLSLTRVQICFQLLVTHSAIQALLFGIWWLSLSLCLPLSPLSFCHSLSLSFHFASVPHALNLTLLFHNILSSSHTAFLSLTPSFSGFPSPTGVNH